MGKGPRKPGQKATRKAKPKPVVAEARPAKKSAPPKGFVRKHAIFCTRAKSYYAGRTCIGPAFGVVAEDAKLFDSKAEAVDEMHTHGYAFLFSEVREVDVKEEASDGKADG